MNSLHAMHQRETRWHVACRRALLCAGIAAALCGWAGSVTAHGAAASAAGPAAASGAEADANANFADFDRSLLAGAGSNTTDLSRFEHGNPVLPGIYNLDVYLNNTWVGRTDVRFAAASPKASATACVTRKLLDQLGLRPAKLAETLQSRLQDPAACVNIGEVI
ncbi:MAG: fimbrial biogenesis outer membrane usher protein, partial [Pusillimonas sp.]